MGNTFSDNEAYIATTIAQISSNKADIKSIVKKIPLDALNPKTGNSIAMELVKYGYGEHVAENFDKIKSLNIVNNEGATLLLFSYIYNVSSLVTKITKATKDLNITKLSLIRTYNKDNIPKKKTFVSKIHTNLLKQYLTTVIKENVTEEFSTLFLMSVVRYLNKDNTSNERVGIIVGELKTINKMNYNIDCNLLVDIMSCKHISDVVCAMFLDKSVHKSPFKENISADYSLKILSTINQRSLLGCFRSWIDHKHNGLLKEWSTQEMNISLELLNKTVISTNNVASSLYSIKQNELNAIINILIKYIPIEYNHFVNTFEQLNLLNVCSSVKCDISKPLKIILEKCIDKNIPVLYNSKTFPVLLQLDADIVYKHIEKLVIPIVSKLIVFNSDNKRFDGFIDKVFSKKEDVSKISEQKFKSLVALFTDKELAHISGDYNKKFLLAMINSIFDGQIITNILHYFDISEWDTFISSSLGKQNTSFLTIASNLCKRIKYDTLHSVLNDTNASNCKDRNVKFILLCTDFNNKKSIDFTINKFCSLYGCIPLEVVKHVLIDSKINTKDKNKALDTICAQGMCTDDVLLECINLMGNDIEIIKSTTFASIIHNRYIKTANKFIDLGYNDFNMDDVLCCIYEIKNNEDSSEINNIVDNVLDKILLEKNIKCDICNYSTLLSIENISNALHDKCFEMLYQESELPQNIISNISQTFSNIELKYSSKLLIKFPKLVNDFTSKYIQSNCENIAAFLNEQDEMKFYDSISSSLAPTHKFIVHMIKKHKLYTDNKNDDNYVRNLKKIINPNANNSDHDNESYECYDLNHDSVPVKSFVKPKKVTTSNAFNTKALNTSNAFNTTKAANSKRTSFGYNEFYLEPNLYKIPNKIPNNITEIICDTQNKLALGVIIDKQIVDSNYLPFYEFVTEVYNLNLFEQFLKSIPLVNFKLLNECWLTNEHIDMLISLDKIDITYYDEYNNVLQMITHKILMLEQEQVRNLINKLENKYLRSLGHRIFEVLVLLIDNYPDIVILSLRKLSSYKGAIEMILDNEISTKEFEYDPQGNDYRDMCFVNCINNNKEDIALEILKVGSCDIYAKNIMGFTLECEPIISIIKNKYMVILEYLISQSYLSSVNDSFPKMFYQSYLCENYALMEHIIAVANVKVKEKAILSFDTKSFSQTILPIFNNKDVGIPLIDAIEKNNDIVFNMYVNHNIIDTNFTDKENSTYFIIACKNSNDSFAIKLLQKYPAFDIHYKNSNNESGISIALKNNMKELKDYILMNNTVATKKEKNITNEKHECVFCCCDDNPDKMHLYMFEPCNHAFDIHEDCFKEFNKGNKSCMSCRKSIKLAKKIYRQT